MTVAVTERPPFDPAFGTDSDTEQRSDFVVDDRLPGRLRGPPVRREDEPERPHGKRSQERLVAPKKRSQVGQG